MAASPPDRSGMLILRIWVEGNAFNGVRARITQTLDSTKQERSVATAATPADIYSIVRRLVETFIDED